MLAKELKPYYEEYTSEVSPADMAISLEMSIFLYLFCDITKPKSILDLGSGFSSFVFRHYQATTEVKPDVWTVDDDEEWLEKTRTFLVLHGLLDENLITLDLFLQRGPKSFDLILHDLGSMETRAKTLATVLTLSHSNGLVILDDVDKSEYFKILLQVTKRFDCELYNLKFYTLDSIGRHAGLLIIYNTVHIHNFMNSQINMQEEKENGSICDNSNV